MTSNEVNVAASEVVKQWFDRGGACCTLGDKQGLAR